MSHNQDTTPAACARIVAAIQRLLEDTSWPIVVARDGGSGAGKSTLAAAAGGRGLPAPLARALGPL